MTETQNSQNQNLPKLHSTAGGKSLPENLKPPKTLVDVTAAFTFSRLPIEQRIAATLFEIFKTKGGMIETDGSNAVEDWLSITEELALYAPKQFVVRYGHLEDGNAKT